MCASKDQDPGAAAALEVLRRALAGRYLLRQEVGRGATAYVYLADDLKHDRPVAVKVLRSELVGRVGVERFLREIRLEARLQHPNIIPLYDSGEADEVTYCVMPYVEGESLRSRLRRERQLPVSEALGIARDVASALAFAHSRGVVHRDVKPENILLSGDRALVADFGVARAIAVAGDDRLTEAGLAVGTPLYMSPEQASAGGVVDARSDVYALGCVVYEMLAGEPPFTGRTPQQVMLRHLHDQPAPLATVRPSLPPHVTGAVTTALAKLPADRFASALDFSRALELGATTPAGTAPEPPRRRRWWRWLLPMVALAAAAGGAWWLTRPAKPLDPNRIVVFPLRGAGPAEGGASGEDVATYIGYVLEGTDPLRWEEGRDLLAEGAGDLSPARASRTARSRGAGFYVDGTVLRDRDSVTVLLRLFDVAGDSMLARAGRAGEPGTSAARLGALAVAELLPPLLEPGREVDVGGLGERRPAAITAFLQGERAYRGMRFLEALDFYRRAVEDDTLFALAAVKGAQAASWLERHDEAEALTGVAERHIGLLPARYAEFVRGWRHFLAGRADSADIHLRRVVALAPTWSEGWMALGEVYYHLLPERGPLDSLAAAAFSEAHRLDREFTPARYHVIELALARGDVATARRLSSDLFRSTRDSTSSAALLLMLRCADGDLDAGGWRNGAASKPADVMEAAATLVTAPALRTCAEQALKGVLATDSLPDSYRANALFGLHALELSRGRSEVAARLAATPDGKTYHLDWLFLLEAAAGVAFGERAADLARSHGSDFGSMPSPLLWARGTWEARRGSPYAADTIAAILEARAEIGTRHRDRLFADAVRAQALLARGDTSAARARLAALKPSAGVEEIAWSLWEPLGIERLTLAEIALARGEHAEALRLASLLDAPAPFVYLIYRPASLQLRLQAARGLKRQDLVQAYESRMSAMGYRVERHPEDRVLELN